MGGGSITTRLALSLALSSLLPNAVNAAATILSDSDTVLDAGEMLGGGHGGSGGSHHGVVSTCKNIPGDAGWPSPAEWSRLNQTVGGRLIASRPLASVCHHAPFGNYNAEECERVRAGWNRAETQ